MWEVRRFYKAQNLLTFLSQRILNHVDDVVPFGYETSLNNALDINLELKILYWTKKGTETKVK